MKKIFNIIGLCLLSAPIYADDITDGISVAGDEVYSYTPYIQNLGYALAAIIGIISAFVIYYAIANNDRNVKKKILTWGGSSLAMLCMSIALPNFFEYQESGLLAQSGGTSGSTNGSMAGGDKYGKLDTTIPDMSDPSWSPDSRYQNTPPVPISGPTRPSIQEGDQ